MFLKPIKASTTIKNKGEGVRYDLAIVECEDHWHVPVRVEGELSIGPEFGTYESAKDCYETLRIALLNLGGLEVKSANELGTRFQN